MKKIGFIGLGNMGKGMSINLSKNDYLINGFDLNEKVFIDLKDYQILSLDSVEEVAKNSEIIITMLSDDDAVLSVISNKDFLENIKKNSIVIDMISTKPVTSKKINEILKKKEIYFLDAPVSGGTSGAKNGNLAIMVGGQKEVFNKALNLLNTMGNPTLVGPIGCGQIAKLANQIIVGVTIGAVAEAIHLCKKSGADPNKFIKAVEGGFADSKILKNHGKKMIENNFEPGGKTSTHLKDMNNILESAESFNFKLPISKLIKEMYQDLVDNNHSEKDHSSLYIQIEELNRNGK